MDGTARTTPGRPPSRTAALAVAALLALAACGGSAPARRAWEQFDATTGTTVVRVAAPLTYASDDPARAANARDYVAVAPLEVIRGTRHERWLWLADWSNIDRRVTNGEPDLPELVAVRLVADGEPVDVDLGAAVANVAGIGDAPPYAARVRGAQVRYLPLTASQLARLGRAAVVELAVTRAGEDERSWPRWSGDPADLAALAALVAPTPPPGAPATAP